LVSSIFFFESRLWGEADEVSEQRQGSGGIDARFGLLYQIGGCWFDTLGIQVRF
jgi:hypothetical protein